MSAINLQRMYKYLLQSDFTLRSKLMQKDKNWTFCLFCLPVLFIERQLGAMPWKVYLRNINLFLKKKVNNHLNQRDYLNNTVTHKMIIDDMHISVKSR